MALLAGVPAEAADGVIKLGMPLALSGPLADAGKKEEQGYELCREAVAAKGGVKVGDKRFLIEFQKYDYQGETNRAIQIVQRLITVDNVAFMFSPYGSGDTKAAAAVAERYEVPMMAPAAASESIFDQNYKNLFGTYFPIRRTAEFEVAHYKSIVPNLGTVAILSMNSLYPKSVAAEIKTAAEKAGLKILFDGTYTPGSTDFAAPLTQIKSLKPDWIYVSGYTQSNVQIRRQMADLAVDAQVVTMSLGPAYPEFEENLKGLAENITTDTWWHYTADYKDAFMFGTTKAYAEAFKAKYGNYPTEVSASPTAACRILMEAIELAGTIDRAAVRKVLSQKQFETFFGPVKFNEAGQNMIGDPLLQQIQGGQPRIIYPAAMKQGSLKLGLQAR